MNNYDITDATIVIHQNSIVLAAFDTPQQAFFVLGDFPRYSSVSTFADFVRITRELQDAKAAAA